MLNSKITAPRTATGAVDFPALEAMAAAMVQSAEQKWAPHEEQDRRCQEYDNKPLWKKLFARKPYGGPIMGRVRAWEDHQIALAFQDDMMKKDTRRFICN
ncbi:MAG: hypothetical protein G01um101456_68 [Parcubacteria group bacterium Gr01-1014_56]|nr:MAG: hypothetical protein G01um101456_68 [Parcubacteria group bacterium Gr01-1014_56]